MKTILFFAWLVAACGGAITNPGNDAGSDASSSCTPGLAGCPLCPSSPPTAGSACKSVKGGPKCEYGTNPDSNCNQLFACTSNAWVDETTGTLCAPQSQCAATYASIQNGQDCTPNMLQCAYPEGECICTTNFGGLQQTTPVWDCFPVSTGCPSPRPDLGSPCTSPGLSCNYGACSGGLQLQCESGGWQEVITPCPG